MKLRRINKDNEFKNKKQKKQKKLKKSNKKRIRIIRRTILFILFIVSLVMLALSSLFNITAIEVYGNNKIDTDALISATKIQIGSNGFEKVGNSFRNYFFFRYGNEENSILNSFPYAKKAKVMFCLPNTVRISVEERIPMFFVNHNGLYILLDEPFTGVDPIAVADLQEIIGRFREHGLGVLLTDHNVRETLAIVDRAYILHDGRVLVEGDSSSVADDPIARKYYFGERFAF